MLWHSPESDEEELAMLIYSDVPIFTARFDAIEQSYDGPDITYFFDQEVSTLFSCQAMRLLRTHASS